MTQRERSQEIVIQQDKPAGAMTVADEATGFLSMLERASRDPNVDVDKMERMMAMSERLMDRRAEQEYNAAFAAMQLEMPEMPENGAIKNKAGGIQSKYVLWEDAQKILKPILTRHGFALTFSTGNDPSGRVIVKGTLRHRGGHSDSGSLTLPIDDSGSKNNVQGMGSSTSYGKRHVAFALLNITSRGEDNDAGDGARRTSLDEARKADIRRQLAAAETRKAAESLWESVASECTKLGDVESYRELHAEFGARFKALGRPAAAPREDGIL